jgi:hypothetical protein
LPNFTDTAWPFWQSDAACREHRDVNFFTVRGESRADRDLRQVLGTGECFGERCAVRRRCELHADCLCRRWKSRIAVPVVCESVRPIEQRCLIATFCSAASAAIAHWENDSRRRVSLASSMSADSILSSSMSLADAIHDA